MKKKIRVGIMGAGGIARAAYLPNLQKLKDVEVVAISEKEKVRGKEVAKEFNIHYLFTDFKEMLKLNLDGVGICLPNFLHKEATIASLKAGSNVLCEKPPALNAQDAKEMSAWAKKKKKILMIGLTWRFRSDSWALKKFIDAGELGRIYYLRCGYLRRRGIPGFGGWFTTKAKSGGGVLVDCGVHLLDLALYFMGNPKAITVSGSTYDKFGGRMSRGEKIAGMEKISWPPDYKVKEKTFDVEDLACALIKLEKGATLFLEVSWVSNIEKNFGYLSLFGDKGGADLRTDRELRIYRELRGNLVDVNPRLKPQDEYFEEMKHFIECIRKNKRPSPSGEEGWEVMKILDAIYLSAKTGKEVKLP